MASSYSARLLLELQAAGESVNTWGDPKLNNVLNRVDFAIGGVISFTLSGSATLTSSSSATNLATDHQAGAAFINVTGGTGGTVTIPSREKNYLVRNNSSGSVVITTGAGATATIPTGGMNWVQCDASNVYAAFDQALYLLARAYTDSVAFEMADGELPGQSGNAGKVLTTDGSTASWGYEKRPWELKTTGFTAEINGRYELDSSGGTIAVTLPAATNSGSAIEFRDKGSAGTNNITLTRAGSDTINGDTTLVVDVDRAAFALIDRSGSWDVVT